MDVTITVPRFVQWSEEDVAEAEKQGVSVTYGIGSVFVQGEIDAAAAFAKRFDNG